MLNDGQFRAISDENDIVFFIIYRRALTCREHEKLHRWGPLYTCRETCAFTRRAPVHSHQGRFDDTWSFTQQPVMVSVIVYHDSL